MNVAVTVETTTTRKGLLTSAKPISAKSVRKRCSFIPQSAGLNKTERERKPNDPKIDRFVVTPVTNFGDVWSLQRHTFNVVPVRIPQPRAYARLLREFSRFQISI